MNVAEFEQAIFEREEVRLLVRAPTSTQLGDYSYVKCSPATTSVTEWLNQRVYPRVGSHQVAVLDGHGGFVHGRTRMSTLRETYER